MKQIMPFVLGAALVGATASMLFRGEATPPEALAESVESGALIIDVRTAQEFSQGHLTGAVNIPYDAIDRVIHQTEADSSRDIVVYCRSGRRSAIAKKALAQVGYTNVLDAGSMRNARAALEL